MRTRIYRATFIAVAALMVAGCATLRVGSHVDSGLVWSKYKTFDWGPADALPAGDARLDHDPVFRDRVEGAIEKAMAARGFERSARSERPDLLIHYHANITERLNVDAERYESGTLVVDIVDASTDVLMWRGWASGSVAGVLGNRERMRRRIDNDVAGIFGSLPQRD
jgi:uncharacterized protein DUF4136